MRQIPASSLQVGDPLPPLDEGRLVISAPAGWQPLPRDSKHLARFYQGDRNSLPRIEITAENSPGAEFDNLTEGSVQAFAQRVASDLASQQKKLQQPVEPLLTGSVPCVRYVTLVQLNLGQTSAIAERMTLVTVKQGRQYSIHLLVLPNTLDRSANAAYSVCSGLKFERPETPPGGN